MLYPNVNVKHKYEKRGKLKMTGEKPSQEGEKVFVLTVFHFSAMTLGRGAAQQWGR